MPPILLRPRCSSSAVVAADFHPEAANLFLLAFADGSAAVYDASLMFRNNGTGERVERPAGSGTGGEIGSITGLHAIGSKIPNPTPEERVQPDDPNGTGIQAGVSGITAVALVPGHRAMAVTVGADGKCCVVDFTQPTRKSAVLLKTWHLRRPATSLSVVYSKLGAHASQLDGADENSAPSNKDYCIAVGRQDGKVLLFDLAGKPLGKQVLDPKGARVVDVEWAKKEIDAALEHTRCSVPSLKQATAKKTSLGTGAIQKASKEASPTASRRQSMEKARDPLFDFSSPRTNRSTTKAVNHLDLPLAVGPKVSNLVGTPAALNDQLNESDTSSRSPMPTSDSTSLIVEFGNSPPPVPPRPTPKPGGKLSERRSMTAHKPISKTSDPSILANTRRKTANDSTPTKLPMPTNSPLKNHTLFGPRSPSKSHTESWVQRQRPKAHYVSPDIHNEPPRGFDFVTQPSRELSFRPEDAPNRNEPPIGLDFASPKSQPLSKLPEPPTAKPSTTSIRSYKTASSQMNVSETSNDTVVDWSTAASSRRPEPSIREPSPTRVHAPPHSFLPVRPPKNALKDDRSKNRNKGHESIDESARTSLSTRSSDSQLSRDTATQDVIMQWPSMRKSPRIADISAGIVSATASVLDLGGYADSSSPEKGNGEASTSPEKPGRQGSISSKKESFIPPRLPLKVSPSATYLNYDSGHSCPCEPHLQDIIRTSLDTFRAEVEQGFKAQRMWLEELSRARENSRIRLEEENRLLRAELSRFEKAKERVSN